MDAMVTTPDSLHSIHLAWEETAGARWAHAVRAWNILESFLRSLCCEASGLLRKRKRGVVFQLQILRKFSYIFPTPIAPASFVHLISAHEEDARTWHEQKGFDGSAAITPASSERNFDT